MKRVLKTIITFAVAAAASAMVQNVFAETYFSENFDTEERVYNQTESGAPFGDAYLTFTKAGNTSAVTADNPSGTGKVLKLTTASEDGTNKGQVNADITAGLLGADSAGISTGRVTMSYDMYIPQMLDNSDSIMIGADKNVQMITLQNSGTTNSNNSIVTKYPIGEWFTVQFTFDYDSDRGMVNMITADDTYTLDIITAKTTFASGVTSFRIHGESLAAAGLTFYIDNLKYYTDTIEDYYFAEKVWYNFDFNATGSNPVAAQALTAGVGGGTKASLDYVSSIAKTALKIEQPVGGAANVRTVQLFNDKVVSSYVLDIGMYIPSTSLRGDDMINVYPCYNNYANRFAVNLKGPESSKADNTALTGCYAQAVFDEEFTLRFVWSYIPFSASAGVRFAEAYIVKQDGTVRFIGKAAVNTNADYLCRSLSIHFDGTNANLNTAYITKIRQYNASNSPATVNFDSGEYAAGQSFANNYVDVDINTGLGGSAGTMTTDRDVTDSSNMVMNFNINAAAAASGNAMRIDTMNYSLNKDSDFVVVSVDMYMPKALEDSETITYSPFVTKDGTYTHGQMYAYNHLTLNGTKAGIKGKYTAGNTYPVGEWFTIRMIYNLKNCSINYSIIDKDGNVENLGDTALTPANSQRATDWGILKQRVHYTRTEGAELPEAKTISIDNLSIKSIKFGNSGVELIDDGWDRYYAGTVNYEAKGDVKLEGDIIMSAYDSETGRYIGCESLKIDRFSSGKHYVEGNIAADPEKDLDVKVMLWNSMSDMIPVISIAK